MDRALLGVDRQFVEDQRVRLLADAPEHHQHDHLQVLRGRSAPRRPPWRDRAPSRASMATSTPEDSRTVMKPIDGSAKQFALGASVYTRMPRADCACGGGLCALRQPVRARSAHLRSLRFRKPTADSLRVNCSCFGTRVRDASSSRYTRTPTRRTWNDYTRRVLRALPERVGIDRPAAATHVQRARARAAARSAAPSANRCALAADPSRLARTPWRPTAHRVVGGGRSAQTRRRRRRVAQRSSSSTSRVVVDQFGALA